MPVYTFLESYDFSGKAVIPFCTHAGSGLSGTVQTLGSKLTDAFVLMSMHISLHFHTMTGMVWKKISKSNRVFIIILRVVGATISAYGLYVFLSRKIPDYMLLKTHFVFFDFSESILFFIFNYVSMMVLFGTIGYYVAKMLRRIDKTCKKMEGLYETKDLCIGVHLFTADIAIGRMFLARKHNGFIKQSKSAAVPKRGTNPNFRKWGQ